MNLALSSGFALFGLLGLQAELDLEIEKQARTLIQQLNSDDPETREKASELLVVRGDEFEEFIEEAAESGNVEIRLRCQDILKKIELNRKRSQEPFCF